MAEFQELACSLSGPSKPIPPGYTASFAEQSGETCASPSKLPSPRASDGEQTSTPTSLTRLPGTSRFSFANDPESCTNYCTLAASLGTWIQPQSPDGFVPHPDTHAEEGPRWGGRHSRQRVETGTSTAGGPEEQVSALSKRPDPLYREGEGGLHAGVVRTGGRMERNESLNSGGAVQPSMRQGSTKVNGSKFIKQWSSMTDCDDLLSPLSPSVGPERRESDGVDARTEARTEAVGTHGYSSVEYRLQGSVGGSSSGGEREKQVLRRADYNPDKAARTIIGEARNERHSEAAFGDAGGEVGAEPAAGERASGQMLGEAFSGSSGHGLQNLFEGRDRNGVYSRSMLFPSQRY